MAGPGRRETPRQKLWDNTACACGCGCACAACMLGCAVRPWALTPGVSAHGCVAGPAWWQRTLASSQQCSCSHSLLQPVYLSVSLSSACGFQLFSVVFSLPLSLSVLCVSISVCSLSLCWIRGATVSGIASTQTERDWLSMWATPSKEAKQTDTKYPRGVAASGGSAPRLSRVRRERASRVARPLLLVRAHSTLAPDRSL